MTTPAWSIVASRRAASGAAPASSGAVGRRRRGQHDGVEPLVVDVPAAAVGRRRRDAGVPVRISRRRPSAAAATASASAAMPDRGARKSGPSARPASRRASPWRRAAGCGRGRPARRAGAPSPGWSGRCRWRRCCRRGRRRGARGPRRRSGRGPTRRSSRRGRRGGGAAARPRPAACRGSDSRPVVASRSDVGRHAEQHAFGDRVQPVVPDGGGRSGRRGQVEAELAGQRRRRRAPLRGRRRRLRRRAGRPANGVVCSFHPAGPSPRGARSARGRRRRGRRGSRPWPAH